MRTVEDMPTTQAIYRRPRRNGDEQDAFSPAARQVIAPLVNQAGVIGKTKARHNRSTRRAAKLALRNYS